MDTAKYAHIVGVFRDRAKADQAVEALKQAGMSDVDLTVYDPQAAGVVDSPVDAGGGKREGYFCCYERGGDRYALSDCNTFPRACPGGREGAGCRWYPGRLRGEQR
jgi:hypothetical protein